jgi:hypothetical protein
MKKVIGLLLVFIAFSAAAWGQQGAEALVAESAAYLGEFFKDKFDVRVAVVGFENRSELGDLALQKIYQMLVSRLEGEKNIRLADLLVDFSNGRGEFNLSQADSLDFLLDLKLVQNKSKTGLGLTVFSRLQNRTVAVKYFEKPLSQGEMELLQARNFAFSALGFSKLLEFESKKNLMDIQSIAGDDGRMLYFFYYPDEIIIYQASETRLEKHFQFKLKWSRPFYPTLHPEGKLLLFRSAQDLVLTAGNNFCPYSQVLAFRAGQWQEAGQVDFVPFRLVTLNQNPYLVGGRYEEGRNYFKDRVHFLPFAMPLAGSGAYQKQTCPAMAMDFSTTAGQLQSIHVIDRDYAYRLFSAGFEEMKPLAEKKGASLAALDGEWLAMSGHSRASDQLSFFAIRDGGLNPAYTGQVDGEVQFIAAGSWQEARGFWAGVRQAAPGAGMERLLVQFWGKRNE